MNGEETSLETALPTLFLILFAIIVVIVIWIIEAKIMNSLHKQRYGKTTVLAWIPLCNVYILGKVTINKTVGWILVIATILSSNTTTTINGVEKTYSLLPSSISILLSSLVSITTFCLLISAVVKYIKLKKSNSSSTQSQTNTIAQQQAYQQQPMLGQQSTYQQTVPQQQNLQQTMAMSQPEIQQPIQPQQPINSFCTNCGAKFNGNEAFCTNCGTPRQ